MGTSRQRSVPHPRRIATLSAAALTGLALTWGTAAAPAHAQSLVPQTDEEATSIIEDRQAEDSSSLNKSNVPDGVSVEQARTAVDKSDEITTADVEYAAALEDLPSTAVPEDFYETPATLPEKNGGVVKQAPSDFYLDPVKLIKHDAETTTYMYRTTDEDGNARAATATLLTPEGASAPAKDAVVIAPGTQGIADKCAPSRQMSMGTEYEGISVASALASKRPVIIADYVGLGTEGSHRYLNRAEEGRSVLDAAKAVQEVKGSGIDAQTKLQLRGYSQGGHATTAALELADDWAPDLNIASASAGAVPTDLYRTLSELSSVYTGLLLYGVASFSEQTGVDLSEHLNQKGLDAVESTSHQCTAEAQLSNAFTDTTTLTKDGSSFQDLVDKQFMTVVEEQRLGQEEIPDVPVLVNHSRLDDVVPFELGRELASTWCDAGNRVAFEDNLGPTHIGGYIAALPRIEIFTNRTFDDKAPLDSCWRL
ncbi:triacylglycerol lipase [Brevibacterium sandarakinum]|uniref:Triacylglycerol lipase n=2 Tax=Brevibacterium sandarakinum TaxID=629680 RepID=A0A1H1QL01_BRESA|nr:lipase family protein [Brevibacterium sandarakinum]SDS24152.1 triacylglycerol lipase [Brevibacterium sandarakinum]